MTITHLITADELESMGSDVPFELIQGVLHEMTPLYTDSSVIAMSLGIASSGHMSGSTISVSSAAKVADISWNEIPTRSSHQILGFIRRERLDIWPSRKGFYPGSTRLDRRSDFRHGWAC